MEQAIVMSRIKFSSESKFFNSKILTWKEFQFLLMKWWSQ